MLFVAVWLCVGAGMFTLLLAAINKQRKGLCDDVQINIEGAKENLFVDRNDVQQILEKTAGGKIKGQLVSSLNLQSMEQALEKNAWVEEAEVYVNNKEVLHVTVWEKEPVARVFTTANSSFYIDSAGSKMPLSEKLTANVPVFTGFPDRKKWNAADSALMKEVKNVANFIYNDDFWMAQVTQVDINSDGEFEMIPLVGNHIIKFGNGDNVAKKFNRLMVFYKQVLSQAGFNKYRLIDVRYKGQVVVSKTSGGNAIDSVQLRKNVEMLLRQSGDAGRDTMMRLQPLVKLAADSADAVTPDLPKETENKPPVKNDKPVQNNNNKPVPAKVPKAVMPPKQPVEESNRGYN